MKENKIANFQDFQLIKTAVERTRQDYGEKYNFSHDFSIAFCWFVLENIFNLQEDEIDEALTDTNYLKRQNRHSADDSGIDAVTIDENKKEVNLINFKYTEEFEKSKQKHFPSNELNKVLVFLDNLFNKEVSCEINQTLKEKCQEIFDIQEINRLHFNIFYISNHFQGLQRNKLKEFKLLGYHYERKKNQYKDQPKEKRLDSEKIGQVLFAYNGKPAEAKNKKSLIFDSEYSNIFNSEIDAKDILKKYNLYLLKIKKENRKRNILF